VITGAASGIGFAAARRFAGFGMSVVLADLPGRALERAAAELSAHSKSVVAVPTDVSVLDDVRRLRQEAEKRFGDVSVLMNNAGIGGGGGPCENYDRWQKLLGVNLWGVIHGVQTFAPAMIARALPSLIVNTGSKQGITTPPGDAAYNVSKAGVKVFTEALAHDLRNRPGCRTTAHLLIPGFTWTGITGRPADAPPSTKPPAAWTADQVVDFMLERIGAGSFYILCPDNDVPRELDQRRIRWAADDIIEDRPPLSRWHPDYQEAFAAFVKA
jgi:NAD(P)-dependent dehydrogenase (short-subunit alcohol dehydrogenase family)